MALNNCGFLDQGGVAAGDWLARIGPTLKVDIGFDPAYDAKRPRRLADLSAQGVLALIDTGASGCCIDRDLAETLALPVFDRQICLGISGPMEVNMYLAQIRAPGLMFTLHGAFAGVELAGDEPHRPVLIGRNFLRHFVMIYDGTTGEVGLVDPAQPMPAVIEDL